MTSGNAATPADGATTTVVVARKAKPGRDAKARRWLQRLASRAGHADGYRRAEIQPPGPQHPGEWVVVYEFESAHQLDAWLASPDRQDLISEETDLFTSSSQQRLVALNDDCSVTAVASFRLESDRADEFEASYRTLETTLRDADGFLRVEHIPPLPGIQDDTAIVFSFRTRRQLDDWLASDERAAALAGIDPQLATDRTLNVVGGFAGWFDTGAEQPGKTWKQATLVLVALYPTALALGILRQWLLPSAAYPVGVLIGNVIGVAILAWVLMPRLTSRFSHWLST